MPFSLRTQAGLPAIKKNCSSRNVFSKGETANLAAENKGLAPEKDGCVGSGGRKGRDTLVGPGHCIVCCRCSASTVRPHKIAESRDHFPCQIHVTTYLFAGPAVATGLFSRNLSHRRPKNCVRLILEEMPDLPTFGKKSPPIDRYWLFHGYFLARTVRFLGLNTKAGSLKWRHLQIALKSLHVEAHKGLTQYGNQIECLVKLDSNWLITRLCFLTSFLSRLEGESRRLSM